LFNWNTKQIKRRETHAKSKAASDRLLQEENEQLLKKMK